MSGGWLQGASWVITAYQMPINKSLAMESLQEYVARLLANGINMPSVVLGCCRYRGCGMLHPFCPGARSAAAAPGHHGVCSRRWWQRPRAQEGACGTACALCFALDHAGESVYLCCWHMMLLGGSHVLSSEVTAAHTSYVHIWPLSSTCETAAASHCNQTPFYKREHL